MLNISINPFTEELIGNVEDTGQYHPNAGGFYYYWVLTPATYLDEEEDAVYLQGIHERYSIPAELTNNMLDLVHYYIDYAYYNRAWDYSVTSGDSWLYWSKSEYNTQNPVLDIRTQADKPDSMVYRMKTNTSGSTIKVTEMTYNWSMVLQNPSGEVRVLNAWNLANKGSDYYAITMHQTKIIGCYALYAQINQPALDQTGRTYYEEGVRDGIAEANTELSVFDYMKQTGDTVGSLFSMQIFPHVTLGTIAVLPIIAALIVGLVKLLRR